MRVRMRAQSASAGSPIEPANAGIAGLLRRFLGFLFSVGGATVPAMAELNAKDLPARMRELLTAAIANATCRYCGGADVVKAGTRELKAGVRHSITGASVEPSPARQVHTAADSVGRPRPGPDDIACACVDDVLGHPFEPAMI